MQTFVPDLPRRTSLMRWLLLPLFLIAILPSLRVAGAEQQAELPELLYSTYLGGDGADSIKDVAVDEAGNILVIGQTFSDTLLDMEIERKGYSDLFVAKFNPTGSQLLYLTVLGGNDSDIPYALEVDAQGNAYGTVNVFDDTFPTKNALWEASDERSTALFKLDPQGDVIYSTYLPDNSNDTKQNLAVDDAGNAYVVGTRWGVQEGETFLFSQISVIKLNPAGTQLLLDRHIGGPSFEYGTALDVDATGTIYLAGYTNADNFPITDNALQAQCGEKIFDPEDYCDKDAVVVILSPAGDVTYASYHGGNGGDEPHAIAADGTGRFVMAGDTISGHFPLDNALQDSCPMDEEKCYLYRGFVSLFSLDAANDPSLVYSTYLGAGERNSQTSLFDATMDSAGNAYIIGYTNGKQFPTQYPVQPLLAEGFCQTFGSERYCFDGFITQFSPTGDLAMSSYLGGVFDEFAYGVAVDDAGTVYVAGATESGDFPTTENGYQPFNELGDDGFLVKIGEGSDSPTATPTTTTQGGTATATGSPTPTGTLTVTSTPTPTRTTDHGETPPVKTPVTGTPSVTPQITPQGNGAEVRLPILLR